MNTLPSSASRPSFILRATTLALLSCGASAADTLINVDLNPTGSATYSGSAVAGGGAWNGLSVGAGSGALIASYNSGGLVSSTGLATPITMSLGNFKAFSGPAPALAPALLSEFVYQPTLGNAGANATFALANLDLGATYDLYFYAQNSSFANTGTIFTIGGVSHTANNTGNIASFVLDTNYVLYTGLAPDASGIISGVFNCTQPANNAAFNGMQIVQHGGTPPPPPPAAATTISVDFNRTGGGSGTFSGSAAAPNAGSLWNGVEVGPQAGVIGSFSSGALFASDGSSKNVTFSLGNFQVYDATENPAAGATALFTDFAYQQQVGTAGPDSTFTISNLDQGFTYDLYLYAQNGGYAGAATKFTINGLTKVATNTGNSGNLIEDTNYVLYHGLTPDASGNIAGTFNSGKDADNAAFGGFQIVQVPEPASLSILAAGAMLTLTRRRRAWSR